MTEKDFNSAFDLFMEYIVKNSDILKGITEENIYNALLDTLQGETREEILAIAKSKTGELITLIDEATLNGIRETLEYGLKNQLGVEGTARKLREQIGLNKQQVQQVNKLEQELKRLNKSPEEIQKEIDALTKQLIKERAKNIAQTEMRKAVQEGEQQVMLSRGARFKVAQSTGDSKVSDICERNERKGPIPIGDKFPSGHDTPPFHPRCRCSLSFVTSDSQLERAKERAEQRAEKTKQAKA